MQYIFFPTWPLSSAPSLKENMQRWTLCNLKNTCHNILVVFYACRKCCSTEKKYLQLMFVFYFICHRLYCIVLYCIVLYCIVCLFRILTFCHIFVLSPIHHFFNVLCSLNLLYHISYLFLTVSH